MAEFGFPAPEGINRELNDKYKDFSARKNAARVGIGPAKDALRALNPSPEILAAMDAVVRKVAEYQKYEIDERWLVGMNYHTPAITDQRMIDVWNGKDIVDAQPGLGEEEIIMLSSSAPVVVDLELLLQEPTDPHAGLIARYDETVQVTRGLHGSRIRAKDTLRELVFQDPEIVEAEEASDQVSATYHRLETDKTWVRALHEHPRIDPQTIIEVWDAIETSRAAERDETEDFG